MFLLPETLTDACLIFSFSETELELQTGQLDHRSDRVVKRVKKNIYRLGILFSFHSLKPYRWKRDSMWKNVCLGVSEYTVYVFLLPWFLCYILSSCEIFPKRHSSVSESLFPSVRFASVFHFSLLNLVHSHHQNAPIWWKHNLCIPNNWSSQLWGWSKCDYKSMKAVYFI